MSEIMDLINKKILENKSASEICQELKITKKRLYYYLQLLKNKGFVFKTEYCSDGEVRYNVTHSLKSYNSINSNELNIKMPSDVSTLKTLVISDLHFGNELERLDLVDAMFNYCIKNDIHIILCCGDILDGTFSKEKQILANHIDQIEYFIKKYPFVPGISTLAVLGDHDFSILYNYNYDPMKIITQHRCDIGIGGYRHANVNIKDETILLHHKFFGKDKQEQFTSKIVLHGHHHSYTARMCSNTNALHINVPALCNIMTEIPSALEMNLRFDENSLDTVSIKQLLATKNSIISLNNMEFHLNNVISDNKCKIKINQ